MAQPTQQTCRYTNNSLSVPLLAQSEEDVRPSSTIVQQPTQTASSGDECGIRAQNLSASAYSLAYDELAQAQKVREAIRSMRANTNLLKGALIREGRDSSECDVLFDRSAKMLDEISTYRSRLNAWINDEWRPSGFEVAPDSSTASGLQERCGIWFDQRFRNPNGNCTKWCCHSGINYNWHKFHTCCQFEE